jgi:hypothetical protein
VAEKKNKAYIVIKEAVVMFKILMYFFKLSLFCSNKDFCCYACRVLLLVVREVLLVLLDNDPYELCSDSSSIVRFLPTRTVDLIRIQK